MKKSNISCHTSPADGEIIVKLCKGNKNILSTHCKDYYKEFVNIKCERPTALYRWEEMYYYADFHWSVLFEIPYKVADVQSLQFKIINRYIPCKENLYLWGKESSDKCCLCNELDTIEHFFAQCSYNRVFWQGVSKLVQRALDINIKLALTRALHRTKTFVEIIKKFCIKHRVSRVNVTKLFVLILSTSNHILFMIKVDYVHAPVDVINGIVYGISCSHKLAV